ncbi:MAG: protein kinase [Eubacterium sp.]|nr:protein kinase [Eubacterium sp.]
MAPEVYRDLPYNHTVDIYSLGIVLYRLLNHNRAPFLPKYPNTITYSDRENALSMRIKGEPIPDIDSIPRELNELVKKACAFNPADRYNSACELKNDLNVFLNRKIDANHHIQNSITENKIVNLDETDITASKKISKKILILAIAILLLILTIIVVVTHNNNSDNETVVSQSVTEDQLTENLTKKITTKKNTTNTTKKNVTKTTKKSNSTTSTTKTTTETTTEIITEPEIEIETTSISDEISVNDGGYESNQYLTNGDYGE